MVVQQIRLDSFYLTLHHNSPRSPEGFPVAPVQIHFFREVHTGVPVCALCYSHVFSWPKERTWRWGVTMENVGCLQSVFGVVNY